MSSPDVGPVTASRALLGVVFFTLVGVGALAWGVRQVVDHPAVSLAILAPLVLLLVGLLSRRRLPWWRGFHTPGGTRLTRREEGLAQTLPAGLPVTEAGHAEHVLRGQIDGRQVVCFEWVTRDGRRLWHALVPLESTPGERDDTEGLADLTQCADPLPPGKRPSPPVKPLVLDECVVATLPNPTPRRALALLRDQGAELVEAARLAEIRALPRRRPSADSYESHPHRR